MADRERTSDMNQAAARFAEALAESYRIVYTQAAQARERQGQLAREFSERVVEHLREQTESGRAASQALADQALRQQEAGRALAQESAEAYVDFLNTAFSRYTEGTERVTGSVQEGVRTLSDTTTGLLGTATGAVGATAGAAAGATQSAADEAQSVAETATFPIPGYDEMNVEEISAHLDNLTDEQVRQLRDYEQQNQNRKTLIDRYDSRLRRSS